MFFPHTHTHTLSPHSHTQKHSHTISTVRYEPILLRAIQIDTAKIKWYSIFASNVFFVSGKISRARLTVLYRVVKWWNIFGCDRPKHIYGCSCGMNFVFLSLRWYLFRFCPVRHTMTTFFANVFGKPDHTAVSISQFQLAAQRRRGKISNFVGSSETKSKLFFFDSSIYILKFCVQFHGGSTRL